MTAPHFGECGIPAWPRGAMVRTGWCKCVCRAMWYPESRKVDLRFASKTDHHRLGHQGYLPSQIAISTGAVFSAPDLLYDRTQPTFGHPDPAQLSHKVLPWQQLVKEPTNIAVELILRSGDDAPGFGHAGGQKVFGRQPRIVMIGRIDTAGFGKNHNRAHLFQRPAGTEKTARHMAQRGVPNRFGAGPEARARSIDRQQNLLNIRVGQWNCHFSYTPRHQRSTAFCACRRFSASSNTTECGPSITAEVASSLRCAGRQCMNRASGLARAISASLT